jgi:hypothetical protein
VLGAARCLGSGCEVPARLSCNSPAEFSRRKRPSAICLRVSRTEGTQLFRVGVEQIFGVAGSGRDGVIKPICFR